MECALQPLTIGKFAGIRLSKEGQSSLPGVQLVRAQLTERLEEAKEWIALYVPGWGRIVYCACFVNTFFTGKRSESA